MKTTFKVSYYLRSNYENKDTCNAPNVSRWRKDYVILDRNGNLNK